MNRKRNSFHGVYIYCNIIAEGSRPVYLKSRPGAPELRYIFTGHVLYLHFKSYKPRGINSDKITLCIHVYTVRHYNNNNNILFPGCFSTERFSYNAVREILFHAPDGRWSKKKKPRRFFRPPQKFNRNILKITPVGRLGPGQPRALPKLIIFPVF